MLMPPPSQSGPPLPEGQVPEDAEQVEKVSSSERGMLIAVAIMLLILFLCAAVFPHLPFTAEL
jgi:hypothetical protein